MARIIGEVESSKSLRAELNNRNISRFNSVGDINRFLKEFPKQKLSILKKQEDQLNEEIKEKSDRITKLEERVNKLREEEAERLNSKIESLTIKEAVFVNKIGSLLTTLIDSYRAGRRRKKIAYLKENFELLINNSTRGLREDVYQVSNSIKYLTENKKSVIQNRGKPEIDELDSIKKAVDELRPLIAGAVGESKVEKEISKLSDDYVLINDFSLKFNPPVYNKKTRDRIFSIQLDHLLISKAGIFALETKNWSKESVNSLDLRSPVDQLIRTSYALFTFVNNSVNLEGHHWGSKQVPIKSIIVMINNKPSAEFKYVKVRQLNELNSYIRYFEPIFSREEVDRIANTLIRKLNYNQQTTNYTSTTQYPITHT